MYPYFGKEHRMSKDVRIVPNMDFEPVLTWWPEDQRHQREEPIVRITLKLLDVLEQ